MKIILLASLVVGCGSEKTPEQKNGVAAPDQQAVSEGEQGKAGTGNLAKAGASMSQGRNTVFGLELPTGMSPVGGPPNVYRFTGAQRIPQVALFIREQLAAPKEEREGEGYLFRFAKVRKQEKWEREIGIRISKSTSKGSTIDIWLEKSLAERRKSQKDAPIGPKAVSVKKLPSSQKPTVTRQTKLNEAVRIMKKLETRQFLTEEEKQSDLFH